MTAYQDPAFDPAAHSSVAAMALGADAHCVADTDFQASALDLIVCIDISEVVRIAAIARRKKRVERNSRLVQERGTCDCTPDGKWPSVHFAPSRFPVP